MLKGEKITLRVTQERDLDTLFDLESDLEQAGDYFPTRLQSAATFKAEFQKDGFWGENFWMLLIVNKDDQILGEIFYFKPVIYLDALEIGYILHDQASRGKGYMTEALSLLVRYLFEQHTTNRLQLTVLIGNHASKRVAEKCGFQSEGILRQAVFVKGKRADLEIFSLLREKWEKN